MPLSFETEDFYFCHAGIRPGIPLDKQAEDDLLWVRKGFHDYEASHPKTVVHGHTPVDEVTHYGNRINIDTGAAWGKELSTICIDGNSVFLLETAGRKPLISG